ncbi:YhdP family phospholipid transporter, partial [Luteimonas sp. SDU101]|uniref:YhdP family phospholipid transporter n=1 Tax=Luteimonas sp. SDU101 TaxID=3422593 RepID=UPI003EB6FB5E
PATLSLRAGRGHVRDAGAAFEAELEAPLSTDELLRQAPRLAWLTPHMAGRSQWRVGVTVPRSERAGAAVATRLQLRSDLVGTALDLPEPLRKPAAEPLPTTVTATLPMEDADIAVAMGNRLALRARAGPAGTGIRVQLGASAVREPPPANGLVVAGRTPELDLLGWTGLAGGDGDGGEDGVALRGIDVDVAALRLLGTRFAETRVQVSQDAALTHVHFDGPALAGTLQVPRGPRGAVDGRFTRLHWQPGALLSTSSGAAAAADAGTTPAPDPAGRVAETDVDPSRVPPLQLQVDDFRFGTLALGALELRTRPTASGLEIERLQTRADSQRLDAGGSWTGRGAAARTQLRVDADSRDFGELMAGLGFGNSIDGGEGRLRFQAEWPRSPGDFALGAVRGELSVAIADGRLVEVEPGAGRVLGLLGVAQLPRRLMLDFRDFFSKGFAFDRIDGTVQFAGGTARSDELAIDGPAAEIRMRGRSDLREQTHDQTIEVHPRTGNLLPAVGAIAGGPVGAAVGAVANAVLKRPLGEMNARTYRVTGSWKDPKVEVVETASTPQAAAGRPPHIH